MGNCATKPKVLEDVGKKRGVEQQRPNKLDLDVGVHAPLPYAPNTNNYKAAKQGDQDPDQDHDDDGTGRRKSLSNLLKEPQEEGNEPASVEASFVEPVKAASSQQINKVEPSELVKPEAEVLGDSVKRELLKAEEATANISETKQLSTDQPSTATELSAAKFADAPAKFETASSSMQVQEPQMEETLNSEGPESSELVKPESFEAEPVKGQTETVEPCEILTAESAVKPESLDSLTVKTQQTEEPTVDNSKTKPVELAEKYSTPVTVATPEFHDAPAQLVRGEGVEVEPIAESAPEPTHDEKSSEPELQPQSSGLVNSEPAEQEALEVESQPKAEPTEPLEMDQQAKPLETRKADTVVPDTKHEGAYAVTSCEPVVATASEFVDTAEHSEVAKPESLKPLQTQASQQPNAEVVNAEAEDAEASKRSEQRTTEFLDALERNEAKEERGRAAGETEHEALSGKKIENSRE